jgi:hypothetical protein
MSTSKRSLSSIQQAHLFFEHLWRADFQKIAHLPLIMTVPFHFFQALFKATMEFPAPLKPSTVPI